MLSDFPIYLDTNETEVQKAVTRLKKKYQAAFSGVNYAAINGQLLGRLKTVKIIQLSAADLDKELNGPGSEGIIATFFTVRTVTDTSEVKNLREDIAQEKQIPPQSVHDSFDIASLQLSQYQNTFEGVTKSHIQRSETNQIISWIDAPLQKEEQPVLLLVGEPGSGKSVILRDTYEQLRRDDVTVIAFKADRYYVSTVAELQRRANLPGSLEACIKTLLSETGRVMVLIDQIDAVSQSVTSQRDCVDTYGQVIHSLKRFRVSA